MVIPSQSNAARAPSTETAKTGAAASPLRGLELGLTGRIAAVAAELPLPEREIFDLWAGLGFDQARLAALAELGGFSVEIRLDGIICHLARELAVTPELVSAELPPRPWDTPSDADQRRLRRAAPRLREAGPKTGAVRGEDPGGELSFRASEVRALLHRVSAAQGDRIRKIAARQVQPTSVTPASPPPAAMPAPPPPPGAKAGASPLAQIDAPIAVLAAAGLDPAARTPAAEIPSPEPSPADPPPPIQLRAADGDLPPNRRRSRSMLGAFLLILLVAAGGALVAFSWHRSSPGSGGSGVARGAALAGVHFEDADAHATVQAVTAGADHQLLVSAHGLSTPSDGGRFSVWLFNSDSDMRRLGALDPDATGRLTLPADASRYRSVHVIFQSGAAAGAAQVLALGGASPVASAASASATPAARQLTVPEPTWADEFSGDSLARRSWQVITGAGGHGNGDLENYTHAGVSVSGGDLRLTARRTAGGITSGAIDTLDRVSARSGLIEADILVPAGTGLWPAFWLEGTDLPSVGWPASGEIDAMEVLDNDQSRDNGSIHTASLTGDSPFVSVNRHPCHCTLAAGYHVYGIDWSPSRIQFMLDGHVYAAETRAGVEAHGGKWTFDKPFFVLLNLAVGGVGDGPPASSTPFPATMTVNWVRIYANR